MTMFAALLALTLAQPAPCDRLAWPYRDLTHRVVHNEVAILQKHLKWLRKCRAEQTWAGRPFDEWIDLTRLYLHCWDRIGYYDWDEDHSLPQLTREISPLVPGYYFGWRPPLFGEIVYPPCRWHPGPIAPGRPFGANNY